MTPIRQNPNLNLKLKWDWLLTAPSRDDSGSHVPPLSGGGDNVASKIKASVPSSSTSLDESQEQDNLLADHDVNNQDDDDADATESDTELSSTVPEKFVPLKRSYSESTSMDESGDENYESDDEGDSDTKSPQKASKAKNTSPHPFPLPAPARSSQIYQLSAAPRLSDSSQEKPDRPTPAEKHAPSKLSQGALLPDPRRGKASFLHAQQLHVASLKVSHLLPQLHRPITMQPAIHVQNTLASITMSALRGVTSHPARFAKGTRSSGGSERSGTYDSNAENKTPGRQASTYGLSAARDDGETIVLPKNRSPGTPTPFGRRQPKSRPVDPRSPPGNITLAAQTAARAIAADRLVHNLQEMREYVSKSVDDSPDWVPWTLEEVSGRMWNILFRTYLLMYDAGTTRRLNISFPSMPDPDDLDPILTPNVLHHIDKAIQSLDIIADVATNGIRNALYSDPDMSGAQLVLAKSISLIREAFYGTRADFFYDEEKRLDTIVLSERQTSDRDLSSALSDASSVLASAESVYGTNSMYSYFLSEASSALSSADSVLSTLSTNSAFQSAWSEASVLASSAENSLASATATATTGSGSGLSTGGSATPSATGSGNGDRVGVSALGVVGAGVLGLAVLL
ncbi:hypothetical protein DV736_g105, partial [Chaetothyriales sp. CBS 134916]